jgi:anti-anti-sigma regulatory factor
MMRPRSGRRAWIAAPAEIDVATSKHVRQQLEDAAAWGVEAVMLDLANTTFCDVVAASALRDARDSLAARHVRLQLLVPPALMSRLLALLGQDHEVAIRPGRRSA